MVTMYLANGFGHFRGVKHTAQERLTNEPGSKVASEIVWGPPGGLSCLNLSMARVLNITFKRAISLKILNLRGKRVFQGHQCGPESRIFGRGKWRRRRWRSVGWPLAGTEGTAASTHSGAARATILGIIGRRVPPNHLLSSLASKYPAAARPIDNEAHTHSLTLSVYLSIHTGCVCARCVRMRSERVVWWMIAASI